MVAFCSWLVIASNVFFKLASVSLLKSFCGWHLSRTSLTASWNTWTGQIFESCSNFCVVYNCSAVGRDPGNLWGKIIPENGTSVGSPYSKRMNQFIARMLSGGLFYAWEADAVRIYLNCKNQMDLMWSSKPVKYPPKVLTLSYLEGAFLLYSLGSLLVPPVHLWRIPETVRRQR